MINTDLPVVVELVEAQINTNDDPSYKSQGRVSCNEYENNGPYLTLRSALMNALSDNSFTFIILEGYISDRSLFIAWGVGGGGGLRILG